MDNPMIQIREFGDRTWSVMARIWNPQKKFYEHPTLINLTKEEAQEHCSMLNKDKPTVEEIEKTGYILETDDLKQGITNCSPLLLNLLLSEFLSSKI